MRFTRNKKYIDFQVNASKNKLNTPKKKEMCELF